MQILNLLFVGIVAVGQVAADCSFTWYAGDGDTCESMAQMWDLKEADFISWNPGVNCAALDPDKEYCIEWSGPVPTPSGVSTTTKTTSGPVKTTTPSKTTTTTKKTTTTTKKTTTTTKTSSRPTPIQTGIVSNCQKWHKVASGNTCQVIVDKYKTFTLAQFYSWNPAVGKDCNSLWLDYYVCIGIPGTPTKPTTTTKKTTTTTKKPSPTPTKPSPTQPKVNSKCKKWHLVKKSTTCQAIVDYYKGAFTLATFYKWNPDVGDKCQSLWLDYYVCVGV